MYKRVLLKISGEQLSGQNDGGIDTDFIKWVAKEVKKATLTGTQMAIVVGGGNFVRGAEFVQKGVGHLSADYMGMLSGMINGLAMADLFNQAGVDARLLCTVPTPELIDDFTPRRALHHLEKNRVVIISGGTGRPNFTHDSAAISLALELDCEVVMKATKVDGVYDKDPSKHEDARHHPTMTFQQAIENPEIKVMDKAALGLAMEWQKPVVVFDLSTEGNIARAVKGEDVGTLVK